MDGPCTQVFNLQEDNFKNSVNHNKKNHENRAVKIGSMNLYACYDPIIWFVKNWLYLRPHIF